MRKINNNLKLVCGTIAGIMIGGITVVGANQAIQAMQNTEIKVSLNGQVQNFKDETTGEVQYPITYHNRTYLPLRNVAQLAGLNVDYDDSTNTAMLNGGGVLYDGRNEYTIFKDKYLLSFYKSYTNSGVESTLVIRGDDISDISFGVSVYEDGDNAGHFMYKLKENKILLTKYVPDGTTIGGLSRLVRVDYEIVENDGIFEENVISIDMEDYRNTAATGYSDEELNYLKENADKIKNNNSFFEIDCIHSKEIGERSGYAEYYYFGSDHSYCWHVDSATEDNNDAKVIASYGRWEIKNGELVLNELAQEYKENHEIKPTSNTIKKKIVLVNENFDNGNGSTSSEYTLDGETWYTNAKNIDKNEMIKTINNVLYNLST